MEALTAERARRAVGRRLESEAFERRVLIAPATLIVLALSLFPLVFSLALTFSNKRLLGSPAHWIGLGNWSRLVHDANFHTALRNTVVFTVVGVAIQYLLGLGLALVLNRQKRLRRFFRVSFLLPMMMSPVAVSYILGKMLASESFGPVNDLLLRLHLPPLTWSADPTRSMAVLVAIDTWQWTPFFILVLLAGLQTIPPELVEAARTDGATARQVFRDVVFPLLIPISATAILIRALEAFKTIDIVRVVTGGGPGNSTETVTLFAYDVGIKGGDIAYASTVAYAVLLLVSVGALVFLLTARRVTPRFA